MASKFLLTMRLSTQGVVKGSSKKKEGDLDYSDGVECHGFEYGVETPADLGSGQPIGRRRHNPIVIRREVDSASPKFFQALVSNETFQSAKLQFGGIRNIELTNGRIVGIKPAASSGGRRCEAVTLEYEDILMSGMAGIPHWS